MCWINYVIVAGLIVGQGTGLTPSELSTPFTTEDESLKQWSDMTPMLGDSGARLVPRQGCVNSGYAPCPDGSGCCRIGENCVPGGCCSAGKDKCGSAYCYNPTTEICCSDGGSCPKVSTCCALQCCGSRSTCEADGLCKGKTCTETSTFSSTRLATHIKTITKIAPSEEEEEAPEFTCPPMSVTNSASETLELGDDCGLTFYPSPTEDPATESASDTALAEKRFLQPRDTDCVFTSTYVVTESILGVTTRTSTVTEQEVTQSFECPPMSVTNEAGDELSLGDDCKLEFSPGDGSESPATTESSVPGSASSVVPSALLFNLSLLIILKKLI